MTNPKMMKFLGNTKSRTPMSCSVKGELESAQKVKAKQGQTQKKHLSKQNTALPMSHSVGWLFLKEIEFYDYCYQAH